MTEENSLAAPAAAPAAEPPSKPLLSWQTATAIATASVGVGAVLLHAIGSIRHNVFLAQLSLVTKPPSINRLPLGVVEIILLHRQIM